LEEVGPIRLTLALLLAGLTLTVLGFFLTYDVARGRLLFDLLDLENMDHSRIEAADFLTRVGGFLMLVLGPLILVGSVVYALLRLVSKPPPDPTTPGLSKGGAGCLGAVVGGIVGLLMGYVYAVMTIIPGQSAGLEALGYFIGPLEGAIIGTPAGWIETLWLRTRAERTSISERSSGEKNQSKR
jgi:hypothetical protein